ncbi:TonB-dependent siderophore receptor [Duganella sp. HH101]|uniref:TonB-dependent receptor plug domain-containing protein n=1 Tax=Duganella sp. HH101 TaxID=1781066 RepID=UPI0008750DA9|nr:TonB-dependent receptor [Duganella sp. HH101]OEZ98162.1 colicin I receptor precursor [Duganella sp. HH101]
MSQIRPIVRAVALLCAGAAPLYAAAQSGADANAGAPPRVEITGSRIKRVDAETASAVQLITAEQIARSGAATVTDVLRDLPSGNAGGYTSEGTPGQAFGSSGVSLRGLGAGATLTLINGRRVAPFGFGSASFVDTNAIPVDAIDRIEVLLDGASAIYGADAIGGVINIILRKNYEGLGVTASAGTSAYHDGNTGAIGLTYGKGTLAQDGYNWLLSLSHRDSSPVLVNARPRTKDSDFRRLGLSDRRSSFSSNAYIASGTTGGSFLGIIGDCPPLVDAGSPLNGRCVNDNTTAVTLQSKSQRDNAYSALTYDLGQGWEMFGDAALSRSRQASGMYSYATNSYGAYTNDLVDKYGLYGNAPGTTISYLLLPADHPQNQWGKTVGVRYVFNDIPTTIRSESRNVRATLGARGTVGKWDVEGAAMFSRSLTDTSYRGYIQDKVLINDVLDADGLVRKSFLLHQPAKNDAGLMGRLYPQLDNHADTSTSSVDLHGNRELYTLPGGALSIAVGAEYRREKFDATPDPLFTDGSIQLIGMTGSNGSRSVTAAYGELSAPVLKSVELSLAARSDRYSDFGSAFTPKAGIKWRPLPQLALRSTYAEGFRAPSLPELHAGNTNGYSKVLDPKRCPVFSSTNDDCERYVAFTTGANPDIQAEKSKSVTIGFVAEPVPGWSLSVDAYHIKRRDELSTISASYLLEHEGQYADRIVRNPVSGKLDHLSLITANLSSTQTRGVDVDARGSFSVGDWGRFSLSASYNRMNSYLSSGNPGEDPVDYVGYYLQPKNRGRAGVAWDRGPWDASLNWNYVGGYSIKSTPDAVCSFQAATPQYCDVHSWLTASAFIRYKGWRNLELSLSVQNLANKEAPMDASQIAYLQGYGTSYHSQLGRFVQLTASYKFK